MKFRTPLIKLAIRYGIIAGLLAVTLLVTLFYIGQHPMMISPFLDFRIALLGIFIFFCLKDFRDNYHDGVLYFWQGMIGSYILIFTSMLVASAGVFILGKVNTSFVTRYIELRTQYLKSFPAEDIRQIGEAAYQDVLRLVSKTGSWELAQAYFGQGIIIGLFISIILTVILRKQPKTL